MVKIWRTPDRSVAFSARAWPGQRIGFQLAQLTDLAMVLWAAELKGGSGALQLQAEGGAGSSLSAALAQISLSPTTKSYPMTD